MTEEKRLQVPIPLDLDAKLEELARKTQRSKAAMVRYLIEREYLATSLAAVAAAEAQPVSVK